MPPLDNKNLVIVGTGAPDSRFRRFSIFISRHIVLALTLFVVTVVLVGGGAFTIDILKYWRPRPDLSSHVTSSNRHSSLASQPANTSKTIVTSRNSPVDTSSTSQSSGSTAPANSSTQSSPIRPAVNLTSSPSAISAGQASTLTWTSTNATMCSASWTSSTAINGSQAVAPGATTTFTITCSGNGGSTSASNTVSVTPQLSASNCTTTLSGSQVVELQNDTYHLQSNEWGSSAPFSICTDNNLDFQITNSGISVALNGAPGAYPSLYKGCHWGYCTINSGLPVQVSTLTSTPNKVTTSLATTTVSSGAWDDSYDIWFNTNSSTSSNSTNGLEMMIWLTHYGSIQPAGSVVASNVSIGGYSYTVWYSGSGNGGTVSYVLSSPTTSVSNLDIGKLAADAVSRNYMQSAWYLIDVEAGFEPWQSGVGLTANSFSVTVQ